MNKLLLTTALCLISLPALSAEMPKPCGEDPRQRCISYQPRQVIKLVLAPGATTSVELPPGETVYSLGASDNAVITGKPGEDRVGVGTDTTSDPNLETTVPGTEQDPSGIVMIKAKKHLEPQPFIIVGKWPHPVTGKLVLRTHHFELETVGGGPQAEGVFFNLTFSDPVAEKEVKLARWKERQKEQEAAAVSDRLKQVQQSTLRRNVSYDGQGNDADRAALAPSAPAGLDAMWDDGQHTFLRFPGNRGSPHAWQILEDGTEAVIGQNTIFDAQTNGSLLIIHKVVRMLRLRDGENVLCITNNAFDPVGANPGTGTVDPGVVRDVKG